MKEHITPQRLANKVRLMRELHTGSFLLVEGESDDSLYGKFVNRELCQIIIAYGKAQAVEALRILEEDSFRGVLAIVDADFDVLMGNPSYTANLLFTDTHDAETLLVRSPALDHVLVEFGSRDKIEAFSQTFGANIRTRLIENARPIGYLRWISLTEELSLKFEELDFKKFLDEKTFTIDVLKMVRTIKDKSQKHALVEQELQKKIAQLQDDRHDPWHVCCGHDLVNILSIGLCKVIGTCNNTDVKPAVLERSLRLAFDTSHFRKTRLYLSMQKWERANVPFVILLNTEV